MMVLGGLVALLVLASMFMPKEPKTPTEEVYDQSAFLRDLDIGVFAFNKKDYQGVIDSLHQPIQKFGQNHAAHILSSLAEKWRDKGEKYEHLLWHEAEDLCKELMDVHPSTKASTQLAENLFKWIKKEEPNMAELQDILQLAHQEKWDLAYSRLKEFPADSRFNQTHKEEISEISTRYQQQHQDLYQKAVDQQRWAKALSELDMLSVAPQPPMNHEELKSTYRGYILDQTHLRQAKDHLEQKSFVLCQEALGNIKETSPYYEEAQRMITLTSKNIHQDQRRKLYHRGSGQEAIAYSQQHMPDDQAFVDKVKTIMDLMEQAQSVLRGPQPELCVNTFQQVLLLEPTDHNQYHMEAKKQVDLWTSSEQLADLFLKRGKEAELQSKYAEARDFYVKAQQMDESYGTEELKAFEKKAYQHYNRAMGYAIKEDFANVKAYLKKSLELITPTSKLYDRIEGYARRNLKD